MSRCSEQERKLKVKMFSLMEWTSITMDVVGRIVIDRETAAEKTWEKIIEKANSRTPSQCAGLLLFNGLGNIYQFENYGYPKLNNKISKAVTRKAKEAAIKETNPRRVAYVGVLSTIKDFCNIENEVGRVSERIDWKPLGENLAAYLQTSMGKPTYVETWMFPIVKGLYVHVMRDIFHFAEVVVSSPTTTTTAATEFKRVNELYWDLVQRWDKHDDGIYSRLLSSPENILTFLLQLECLKGIPKSVVEVIVSYLETNWEQVLHRLLTWQEFKFVEA